MLWCPQVRGFAASNLVLQRAARDTTVLQNEILTQRVRQREHLQAIALREQQLTDQRTQDLATGRTTQQLLESTSADHQREPRGGGGGGGGGGGVLLSASQGAVVPAQQKQRRGSRCNSVVQQQSEDALSKLAVEWSAHAEEIRKATFVVDVREFFVKFHNAQTLQRQMADLHRAAELRKEELKRIALEIEAELEQVRYDTQSIVGTNSRDARELQQRLAQQLHRHKHERELALASERLRQAAFGGVKHVCTTLGIPAPDQDTPVNEIIHQVESVLEALMEEKDKSAQKMAGGGGGGGGGGGANPGDTTSDRAQQSFRTVDHQQPGYDKIVRAPELDAALEQFETPKALIANRLPAKAPDESKLVQEDDDNDAVDLHDSAGATNDQQTAAASAQPTSQQGGPNQHVSQQQPGQAGADDTVKLRADVKREALKNIRAEQRRKARLEPPP